MACRYCKSINTKTYKKIGNYDINYCNKCHLLFTVEKSISVANVVNRKWYSYDYISSYLNRAYDLKKRFNQKIREIESIKKGGNLLDLGCGVGLFLESINETAHFRWRFYGVDINSKLIKVVKRRLGRNVSSLYTGRLTSLKLKKNYFDCVTCFDVLEHDDKLELTLKEIKRILKPSGVLLIQSPNYRSVMAYLSGSLWDWWAVPDHIFHFDAKSLSRILEKVGFRIKKLYTWDPQGEFISNIRGSVKSRLCSGRAIGKLISKCLYMPLLVIWGLTSLFVKKFNIGGLLVVIAEP